MLAGLLLAAPGPAAGAGAQATRTPRAVGRLVVEDLLARGYMRYGDEGLHYAEAAAAVGALRFAAATGDQVLLGRLLERYRPLLDENSGLVSRREHVDQSVVGILPLQIAMATGDPDFLAQGLSFADRQWEAPLPGGLTRQTRWWIDDLYMVGMLQIQAFRATGEGRYADRAARQLAAYLDRLQQPNGLFHHGPGAPVFWGRGNGWVAVAMAEVLASLPAGHKLRPRLLGHYRAMMQALSGYQRDDGMWGQLIDDPAAWPESSATAMFAYAMALGLRHGLLDGSAYRQAVQHAWLALLGHLDDAGNIGEVCVGTGKSDDIGYYLARPRVSGDLHGQAPLLWLATELLQPF